MPSRIIPSANRDQFADDGYPRMYFVEPATRAIPPTGGFPIAPCAEAMLRSAGFAIVAHPEDEVFICRRTAR